MLPSRSTLPDIKQMKCCILFLKKVNMLEAGVSASVTTVMCHIVTSGLSRKGLDHLIHFFFKAPKCAMLAEVCTERYITERQS